MHAGSGADMALLAAFRALFFRICERLLGDPSLKRGKYLFYLFLQTHCMYPFIKFSFTWPAVTKITEYTSSCKSFGMLLLTSRQVSNILDTCIVFSLHTYHNNTINYFERGEYAVLFMGCCLDFLDN